MTDTPPPSTAAHNAALVEAADIVAKRAKSLRDVTIFDEGRCVITIAQVEKYMDGVVGAILARRI